MMAIINVTIPAACNERTKEDNGDGGMITTSSVLLLRLLGLLFFAGVIGGADVVEDEHAK